jgi:hypothetical protein
MMIPRTRRRLITLLPDIVVYDETVKRCVMLLPFKPISFLTGLLRLHWQPAGEQVYFKTEEDQGRTFFYFFSRETVFMCFFRHLVNGECIIIIVNIEKNFDDVELIYELVKAAMRVVANDQPVRVATEEKNITVPFVEALLRHGFIVHPKLAHYTIDDRELILVTAYKPSKDEWDNIFSKKK